MKAKVKFFNTAKAFGFLIPDDGSGDIYFNAQAVRGAPVKEGNVVYYDAELVNGKMRATRVARGADDGPVTFDGLNKFLRAK